MRSKFKIEAMEQLAQAMAHLVKTQQQQLQQQKQRDKYLEEMLKTYLQDQQMWGNIKINLYVEGENIEDFLLTFERAMVLQDISEEEWPAKLMSVLC